MLEKTSKIFYMGCDGGSGGGGTGSNVINVNEFTFASNDNFHNLPKGQALDDCQTGGVYTVIATVEGTGDDEGSLYVNAYTLRVNATYYENDIVMIEQYITFSFYDGKIYNGFRTYEDTGDGFEWSEWVLNPFAPESE